MTTPAPTELLKLADRIEAYLEDAPMYGGHSDKAGASCWELLRQAMDEIRYSEPVERAEVAGEAARRAVELLEEAPATALRALVIEECANIAEAIDSGRGNEKQIAKSIRALASPPRSEGVRGCEVQSDVQGLIREHIAFNRFNENEDGTTVIDSSGLVLTLSEALRARGAAQARPDRDGIARIVQEAIEETYRDGTPDTIIQANNAADAILALPPAQAAPNLDLVKALNDLHVWLEVEGCGDQVEIINDAFRAAGITEHRCANCDGAGEWDEGPLPATSSAQISPDYRHMVCSDCEGKGTVALPSANGGAAA